MACYQYSRRGRPGCLTPWIRTTWPLSPGRERLPGPAGAASRRYPGRGPRCVTAILAGPGKASVGLGRGSRSGRSGKAGNSRIPYREDCMISTEERERLRLASKGPEVTIYFWIIKVLATTVGETAADLLSVRLDLGLTVTSCVMGAVFVAALVLQVRAERYQPPLYWITVVLISIVGTLVSDN